MRYLISIAAALIGFSSALFGKIDADMGSFSFPNPRTGEAVRVFYVKAHSYDPSQPPIMVFHGLKRNADEYRDNWIKLAIKYGFFVVAPEFNKKSYPDSDAYNLGGITASKKKPALPLSDASSFRIPEDVFEQIHTVRRETDADGYLAFGHSAGAQFLHRKLSFAPDKRLLLTIAANAGWYTLPDEKVKWPYGFGATGYSKESLTRLLESNLVIMLGDQDTDPRHKYLHQSRQAKKQGPHRFSRGKYYYQAGVDLAAELEIELNWHQVVVHGAGHFNAQMAPSAAELMAKFMLLEKANPESQRPQ
ncbi:hypothetical protein VDG1235_419 [Verrucomicrobiia bacterium DG1235]|nr:hypothetical protein VDG1235_419 [Verrucomicrobiae bacterium DG1235]